MFRIGDDWRVVLKYLDECQDRVKRSASHLQVANLRTWSVPIIATLGETRTIAVFPFACIHFLVHAESGGLTTRCRGVAGVYSSLLERHDRVGELWSISVAMSTSIVCNSRVV